MSRRHARSGHHRLTILTFLTLTVVTSAAAQEVTQITEVEGITEYSLDNGLRFLLFPDASKPTATVNVTYFVGSRHEAYGETGMAPLLEHLVFQGTPDHPNIDQELTEHGARPNGTPSFSTLSRRPAWIDWRMGQGFADHFMVPYNQKIWSRTDLDEMSSSWVAGRV